MTTDRFAAVHRGETDEDYARCAAIYNALNPASPIGVSDFHNRPCVLLHSDAGYAIVKESSVAGCAFTMVRVRAEERGRGVGSELLAAASDEARALGLEALYGRVEAADDVALGWVTRRGFVEISRDIEQSRALDGVEPHPVPPPGIELRPGTESDLENIYAVAVEATPDLAMDAEVRAQPYELWLREHARATFHVAVEGGHIVGFGTLTPFGVVEDTLEHELTAVLRSHRRRGIGSAVKREQIAWAAENGYRRLITWTQTGNHAMRSLNLSLGYVERPDTISVKGPLQ
jgi:GNAT superfamily N-acetyltransferase